MRAINLLTLFCPLMFVRPAIADEPPRDTLIDSHTVSTGPETGLCDDAEFLRRVSLDLIGMPPAADRTRAFVADESPDKRARVVDELLRSPLSDRHIATMLDVMLMERRSNTHVPQENWSRWLHSAVRNNRPWNEIVRDILTADGDDPAMRPAARFFLDRQSEQHLLTRDIGRIFFGRDMQCAQCHDHPLIDDYLQADYHGLLAFVAPGYPVIRKVTKKEGDTETTIDVTVHAEKAGNDLTFSSVFIEESRHRTGPRLPDDVSLDEPFQYPGEEYRIAPAEGVKSVPKYSRRTRLAELATNGTSRAFNENIANRLWAHMLGRGLVHPVDLHHPDNPPTHPELLQQLGERFAAMGFNVRGFLREIALSQCYQRAFDRPQDPLSISAEAAEHLSQLETQRATLTSVASASSDRFQASLDAWQQAETQMLPAADALDAARKASADANSQADTAVATMNASQTTFRQNQAALTALRQAATATQNALIQLPNDAELTATVETLTRRVATLNAETDELTKTVTQQTAAAAAARAAASESRTALDAALAAIVPYKQKLQQAEQTMLNARRVMQSDAAALASIEQQFNAARLVTSLAEQQQSLELAQQTVNDRESALATARTALAASTMAVEQNRADVLTTETQLAAAAATLQAARVLLAERQISVSIVQSAADSAQSASRAFPADVVLADAATRLTERFTALSTAMAEFEQPVEAAQATLAEATKQKAEHQERLNEAVEYQAQHQHTVDEAMTALNESRAEFAEIQAAYNAALADLTEHWSRDFSLATLKPLTPEQLGWSVLKVTGVYDRYWRIEEAELDKTSPATDEQKQDVAWMIAREREIEQRTYDRLKSNVTTFVSFYAAGAGQPQSDFFATADQALFAANGAAVNSWLAPSDNNVTQQLANSTDAQQAAESLYLTVLNRFPSAEETADVAQWMNAADVDRATVSRDLAWGLLNSIEFRFNH